MSTSPFQDKKERTDFFISIAVVALFGIFIGYYMLSDGSTEERSLEAMLDQPESTVSVAPITAEVVHSTTITKPQKKASQLSENATDADILSSRANSTIYKIDSASTHSDHITAPISTDSIKLDVVEDSKITDTAKEAPTSSTSESNIVANNAESIDSDSGSNTKEGSSTSAPSLDADKSTTTSSPDLSNRVVENIIEGKDCRIIVGAYAQKASRDRMLKKLAETDYQVVTYKEKGLNIVAIHHSCDKAALKSSTKKIREKYAKGAFTPQK